MGEGIDLNLLMVGDGAVSEDGLTEPLLLLPESLIIDTGRLRLKEMFRYSRLLSSAMCSFAFIARDWLLKIDADEDITRSGWTLTQSGLSGVVGLRGRTSIQV